MRSPSLAAIGFLGLTLAAPAARAQRSPDAGPELAVRTGIAIPFGQTQDAMNSDLNRYAGSAVPLVVEAGYRVDSTLFFGARFQYAFPQLKNPNGSCSGGTSCDGSIVQLAVEGIYRMLAGQTFAPWVGLGAGYEWLSVDYNATNGGLGATVKGFQGLAQAGGDVRVSTQLVLGPFVEASFGRYDSSTARARLGGVTSETNSDISNTAWHTWVTVGVRGAFGF
jgi:hypothetical protein